jgi:undecaprenyl-diphosphatase
MAFLESLDQGAWNALQTARLRVPWLEHLLTRLRYAGTPAVLLGVTVLSAVLLRRSGRRGGAGLALVAFAGALAVSVSTQALVNRPRAEAVRTDTTVKAPESASFPSGSALTAAAVYGYLALSSRFLLGRRARRAAVLACVVLTLLAGYAPLGLSENYLSDVLAGWVAGLAWATACAWAAERIDGPVPEHAAAG